MKYSDILNIIEIVSAHEIIESRSHAENFKTFVTLELRAIILSNANKRYKKTSIIQEVNIPILKNPYYC